MTQPGTNLKTDEEQAGDQGRRYGRGWLVAVLLLGYLLRLGFAFDYEAHHPWADRPVIDEASYERWALEVASGDFVGEGVFFQEPLYPYALALVFAVADDVPVDSGGRPAVVASERQRTAARHSQAFLGTVLVGLVFALTRRAFGVGPALLAAFAAATYRPLLLLPCLLLKPNLFLPIAMGLLLILWSACRASAGARASLVRWLAVGLLAGAASLLRGNALILLPLVLLAPFIYPWPRRGRGFGKRLVSSAAIALGIAALLFPVALRNQQVGGVFALSTSGAGTNVYGGNAPENPYGMATEFPWVRGIPEYEAADWRREAERRTDRRLDPGEVSRYWLDELWASLVGDPAGHALRLWHKLRLSLGSLEVPDNHDLEWDARYLASLRVPFPGWGLWGSLGLAGLLSYMLAGRRLAGAGKLAGSLLALAFLAYLGTIVLTVTSGRIRLMLVPLILPFSAWMCFQLIGLWKPSVAGSGKQVPAPILLGSLVPALLLVFVPLLPVELRLEKLDGRDVNHVRILLEGADQLDQAESLVQELLGKYPTDPRLATLEAEVRFRRAGVWLAQEPPRRDLAGEELQQAMARLAPVAQNPEASPKDHFHARLLAGLCQLRSGSNPGAARRHFEAALDWDPSDRVARLGLANALALLAEQAKTGGASAQAAALRGEALGLLRQLRQERDEQALELREHELLEMNKKEQLPPIVPTRSGE